MQRNAELKEQQGSDKQLHTVNDELIAAMEKAVEKAVRPVLLPCYATAFWCHAMPQPFVAMLCHSLLVPCYATATVTTSIGTFVPEVASMAANRSRGRCK